MADYTKGEWKASYHYPYNVYATDGQRPPTVTPIATMTAPDQVEREANAHLIASAPKLYEALKGLAVEYQGTDDAEYGSAYYHQWQQATKALAEAEEK